MSDPKSELKLTAGESAGSCGCGCSDTKAATEPEPQPEQEASGCGCSETKPAAEPAAEPVAEPAEPEDGSGCGCGCSDTKADQAKAEADCADEADPCGCDPAPQHGQRSGPEEKRMQGHWLLAKMGKRVLRPGGIELTRAMLKQAKPASGDRIVEFGPGVGRTAEILLAANPKTYTGVDPNPQGAEELKKVIAPYSQAQLKTADAIDSGLPSESADLVITEAMLTMQSPKDKAAIISEAARILAPGGRYAIHELGFVPDDVPEEVEKEVAGSLSRTIKVGARPLTVSQWRAMLEAAGLKVVWSHTTPMRLLEPSRLISDEGFFGFLRFVNNVRRNPAARERILAMRATFRANKDHLAGVSLVAVKPRDKS